MPNKKTKIVESLASHEELSFILIRQKDKLIKRIDSCTSLTACDAVNSQLNLLRELWYACSYTYKTKELRERLRLRREYIANKPSNIKKESNGEKSQS